MEASEDFSDATSTSVRDQIYLEQLAALEQELDSVEKRTHHEYLSSAEIRRKNLEERLELNEINKNLMIERVNSAYEREKVAAKRELEERKAELLETLLAELEEKRKLIEHEHASLDLTGDSLDVKPMTTRKLRRRPNEPLNNNFDKRPRKGSPPQITYTLSETAANEDLLAMGVISSSGTTTTTCDEASSSSPAMGTPPSMIGMQLQQRHSPSPCYSPSRNVDRNIISVGDSSATIEAGRVFFAGKSYLRGQTITVETSDFGKLTANIQAITTTNEIYLKAIGENRRFVVSLAELRQGRVLLKKKT